MSIFSATYEENIIELDVNTAKGFVPLSVNHLKKVFEAILPRAASFPPHMTLDGSSLPSILSVLKYSKMIDHNLRQVFPFSSPFPLNIR